MNAAVLMEKAAMGVATAMVPAVSANATVKISVRKAAKISADLEIDTALTD